MSFGAKVPAWIAGEDAEVDTVPWFAAVPASRVREVCRLDGTVTAARLGEAISNAMDSVNRELKAYKAEQVLAGAANLAAAGDGRQPGRYLRAIYAHIQAELAEVYRDIDTTPHNDSKAERMRERYEVKVDEHRRNLRWAIADLLGRPRTTVELI